MDIKGDSCDSSERKESCGESFYCNTHRGIFNRHEQSVGRKMKFKGVSGEVSERYEEHVIGNWRKGESCYKVAKNSTKLCFHVLRKVKFITG